MIRLRRSRPEQQGYSEDHIMALQIGFCFFGEPRGFFQPDGSPDENSIRLAWTTLKPSIMAKWNQAGKRPWAWWVIDSPARRDKARYDTEAEQLHAMYQLTPDENESLKQQALIENNKIHSGWSQSLPFRRSWLFWHYLAEAPRDPAISEYEQLKKLGQLSPIEKAIRANPGRAMAGELCGCRSRFYYLSRRELSMLGMKRHPDIETLENTRSSV